MLLQGVLEMYSLFFPVYKCGQGCEIDILRPIDNYVLPTIKPEIINSGNVASLLAYLINLNFMHEADVLHGSIETLNTITASILFHLSAKYFGFSDASQDRIEQLFDLVNSFSYDPREISFFGLGSSKIFCQHERTLYETNYYGNFSIYALCSGNLTTDKGTIELSENCKWYCQTVVNNHSAHKLVRSFYAMSVDLEGSLVSEYPATLLPVCKFSGEGKQVNDACWTRIVNDKGICFASDTGV